MRWKMLVVVMVTVAGIFTLSLGSPGCGAGGRASHPKKARDIEDGSTKYFPRQFRCPVCGTAELNEEQFVDIDGKRIYFDRAECIDKFNQAPRNYLQRLHNQMIAPPGKGPGRLEEEAGVEGSK